MRQVVKPRVWVLVWAGNCHEFVRKSFGAPPMFGSAWSAWEHAKYRHTGAPPSGVAVPCWFEHYGTYGRPARYGNWGHTVVSMGDGTFWSSPGRGFGRKRFTSIQAIEQYFRCRYVGWTEDVNGVRVVEPGADSPIDSTIFDTSEEDEEPMKAIYYKTGGTYHVAVIQSSSGLFAEYSTDASSYNNRLDKALGLGSFAEVTEKHYEALKADFAKVRAAKA